MMRDINNEFLGMPDTASETDTSLDGPLVARTARSITIEYPGTLPLALRKNRGNTTHWDRAKETKNLRETAYWLIHEARGERDIHFNRATVEVHQWWCGKALDVSGLASASAALVDAFMDAGIIDDDGPEIVVKTSYSHTRVPHKTDRRVVVTCTEILE